MNKPLVFGVNSPSPFGALPEGAALMIGPRGIDLVVSFGLPTEGEIAMVRKAPIKAGLALADGIATSLLIRRFDGAKPIMLDTPFNVCLDPRPEMWRLPERRPTHHLLMNVFLQDRFGILRALRAVTIPPKLIEAIEATVAGQATLARSGHWHAGLYDSEIDALYRRWPRMQDAMRDAVRANLGE